MNPEITPFFVLVVVIGLPITIWVISVRNDLGRRWEKLLAHAANVVASRQRRQGVGQDVVRHVGHAQLHEQRVTQFGSQRGRGGGRLISDIANGWPITGTTSVTGQAMTVDIQSRDVETNARIALHQEAEKYNDIVRSFPSSVVAGFFGFRPWRYGGSGKRQPMRKEKSQRFRQSR